MDFHFLRSEFTSELKDNILHYWITRMVDHEYGGFLGRRNGNDEAETMADKGVILNTRILWTFSQAARQLSDEYRQYAERAYEYLVDHFIDHTHGGVYWMVDFTGKPVNKKKQIYAQAFAIYALSEYYILSRNDAARDLAIAIFELVEARSFDQERSGYLEAFDESWHLLQDLRLSEKDVNEKKTMNTHLHLLEGYTNLYRCWPETTLRRQIVNLISVFQSRIIRNDHFGLFFDENWGTKGDTISYGHDIEGSWLLYEAAEVLQDRELVELCGVLAVRMVNAAISDGIDPDGGLKNESHDPGKDWWPQAEALVGLMNAFQLTGDRKYITTMLGVWTFIKNRLIDHKNGEWFWGIDCDGNIRGGEDKAGPWKCPYHNSRAMFEMLKRLPT